uniref:Apolipoprotein N-acyltransferase (EC) n=1 Tax=uncultured Thiotrichaceae bacterium TaxID=298394 RepID=A0A6S6S637_9GAMM|nr:MAG: Apolipoprotein N-acyltransferase (EC [uncultured Thiotrichaceae bacterium]
MNLYKKISQYFTLTAIAMGFCIAFLTVGAIYLDWFGVTNYFVNSLLGLLSIYLLLITGSKVWLWTGFWTGVVWFWWFGVSFHYYGMTWAIPLPILGAGIVYALIFLSGMTVVGILERQLKVHHLIGKILFLLILSYIHPLGSNWYKPELMFTNTYMGVEKWQFFLIMFAVALSIYTRQAYYLAILVLAYPFATHFRADMPINTQLELHGTYTNVKDKWKPDLQPQHINDVFAAIQEAITAKKRIIVLPESIFALYLNKYPKLIAQLNDYSHDIAIVVGGLYMDENTPRNSTYIFQKGTYRVANKVKLVPFGEGNPLPDFMGKIVNKIFFDGAPSYVASAEVTDYEIDGVSYRNAICFEATSEELYEGKPQNMIVVSNNGWMVPSIEPTEQKILLQYYSKKYGTTIYHSVNMSPSYIVHNGKIIKD